MRQVFIIQGVVSEEKIRETARDYYNRTGHLTQVHHHSAGKDCNARCHYWPIEENE